MRAALAGGAVPAQALLMPEVVELDESACDRLEARAAELAELGVEVTDSAAPFVLAKLGRGTHAWLRGAGIAVRRADTFPGLDDTWARLAVREPDATQQLLTTLRSKDTWS